MCVDSQTDGQQQKDNVKSRRVLCPGKQLCTQPVFMLFAFKPQGWGFYHSDFSIKKTNFSASQPQRQNLNLFTLKISHSKTKINLKLVPAEGPSSGLLGPWELQQLEQKLEDERI